MRTRQTLVVAQIGLSLVLLVGAVLMIRTFLTLRPTHPGFTTTDKLTTFVRLQGPRAAAPAPFFDALLERVARMPGVQGVTASTYLPVSGSVGISTIRAGTANRRRLQRRRHAELLRGDADSCGRGPRLRCARRSRRAARGDRQRRDGAPVWTVSCGARRRACVTGFDKKTETLQIVGIIRDTRCSGGNTKACPELYGALRAVAGCRDEPDRADGESVGLAAPVGHP